MAEIEERGCFINSLRVEIRRGWSGNLGNRFDGKRRSKPRHRSSNIHHGFFVPSSLHPSTTPRHYRSGIWAGWGIGLIEHTKTGIRTLKSLSSQKQVEGSPISLIPRRMMRRWVEVRSCLPEARLWVPPQKKTIRPLQRAARARVKLGSVFVTNLQNRRR